jgi:hypothetical protein
MPYWAFYAFLPPHKNAGVDGWFFFCDQSSMDIPTDAGDVLARIMERNERMKAKHKRYYTSHRDVLRQKAHERYYKKTHNI